MNNSRSVPDNDNRSAREVGEQAISELERLNWTTGSAYKQEDQSVCGIGAIISARLGFERLERWGASGMLLPTTTAPERRFMLLFLKTYNMSIPQYNDTVADSKEDMIEAFQYVVKQAIEAEV